MENITTQTIIGIFVLAGIIMGLLVPIVAIVTGNYGTPLGRYEWFHKFISWFNMTKKLVETKEINVTDSVILDISTSSGAVRIVTSNTSQIIVKIYEIERVLPLFFRTTGTEEYRIVTTNNTVSISVEGYYLEVLVPDNITWSLVVNVAGGAVELDINAGRLTGVTATISGGVIDFKAVDIGVSNITLDIDGGVCNLDLKYREFTGSSKLSITVSGGVLDSTIKLSTRTKIAITGSITGGVETITVDNNKISLPYTEQGYNEASSKLNIALDISGGVADIEINRW
ncbi:hypothetical protein J4526_08035 [Desulfurococcaceae archaeon MEX13E-LK6-19]|nr:hypothetical protein J4526_08035 [Desulfurococcaceae archaeon MEX13E-LK6-19]